jgi:hypothetical protein
VNQNGAVYNLKREVEKPERLTEGTRFAPDASWICGIGVLALWRKQTERLL